MNNKYNMDDKFNIDNEYNTDDKFNMDNEYNTDDKFNMDNEYNVDDKFNINDEEINKNDEDADNDDEEIEVLELWEPHADEITDAKDRHIKLSRKTTNKIVIALVAIGALLLMWYSTFAQPLASNNKQYQDETWKIGFTAMKADTVGGKAKVLNDPTFTDTSANFEVSLSGPGDKIVYDLTIENKGDLNAKVDSISITPKEGSSDKITYTVSDINVGDRLDAGESTHMKLTVMYNDDASSTDTIRSAVTVIVTYNQA